MKFLLILIGLSIGSIAHADYNNYEAKQYTCSELKTALQTEGAIRVHWVSLFGFNMSRVPYSRQVRGVCGSCYRSSPFNLKAKDRWCSLGRLCVKNSSFDDDDRKRDDDSHQQRRQRNACKRAPFLQHN